MQRPAGQGPCLTVVVPAPDVSALEDTLVSVLEHRPDNSEIVVALGAAYDDPWNIGEEVTFVDAGTGSGLVDCVAAGVAAATGGMIHVLAAGWRATDGWTEPAVRHLARPGIAAVVPLAVADGQSGRPVAAGVRRTLGGRGVTVVPRRSGGAIATGSLPSAPLLEAGFWRADVLREIGFSAACGDALAAADMAAALTAARVDVVLEPESVVVAGKTPRGRQSAFLAGLYAERLFWRSLPCDRVAPALVAHVGELLRHVVATAPLGTLGMLAGRLAAVLHFGSCVGRARQLRQLMQQASEQAADGRSRRSVRIDAPHETVRQPRVEPPQRELRRSA